MAYTGLADFVETLDQAGELLRIKPEVSPELEVAEITDRVSKSKDGGPALLFENVAGSEIPLLINASVLTNECQWHLELKIYKKLPKKLAT